MGAASPTQPPRLQAGSLTVDTFRTVQGNIGALARAALVPWAISVLALRLGILAGEDGFLHFLSQGVHWALIIAYYVTVHRVTLLGAAPSSFLGVGMGGREIRYFGYSVVVAVAPALAGLLVFYATTMMGGSAEVDAGAEVGQVGAAFWFMVLPALVVAAYLGMRLSLALPAVAVDVAQPFTRNFAESWARTKGNVLALFAASLLIAALFFLAVIFLSLIAGLVIRALDSTILEVAFSVATDFAGVALNATMLSVAYRQLGGAVPAPPPVVHEAPPHVH